MSDRIDLSQDMYFYDDRNKYDYMYRLVKILYSDDTVALCEVSCTLLGEGIPDEKFLIKIANGEVINSDYYSWYATNDLEWAKEEDERIQARANDY
jgi:hypothetical protein